VMQDANTTINLGNDGDEQQKEKITREAEEAKYNIDCLPNICFSKSKQFMNRLSNNDQQLV
jgi:hypothetical protein